MYQLDDIVLINTRGRDPDVQPTINAEMFRASGKLGRIKSITAYGYYKVECLDDDKILMWSYREEWMLPFKLGKDGTSCALQT